MSYEVYEQVAGGFTGALISRLLSAGFIWWLADVWRMGAIILFVVFTLFILADVLQVVLVLVTSVAAVAGLVQGKLKFSDEKWIMGATVIRGVGASIGAYLAWFLFGTIWP